MNLQQKLNGLYWINWVVVNNQNKSKINLKGSEKWPKYHEITVYVQEETFIFKPQTILKNEYTQNIIVVKCLTNSCGSDNFRTMHYLLSIK